MYPVTQQYLTAIRGEHGIESKAVHRNLITGVETVLDIEDGSVTVDSTSNIRRTLNLTLPPDQSVYDTLDSPGGEITVTQAVIFADGSEEWVPLGVFIVDSERISYDPGDTLTLSCPDRWLKVQRARFTVSRASVRDNTAWQEIRRLVEAAWPGSDYPFPGWAALDTTVTAKVGTQLWDDGDREAAIMGLVTDNSLQLFFDADGLAVLRIKPVLTPSSPYVWTVNDGEDGVMIGADEERDMSRVRNAIYVTTAATDVTFLPVLVSNLTVGDPLSVTGPLGTVTYDYSSPTLRNSDQAWDAGQTMLRTQLGQAKTMSITSSGNAALDADDVILATIPQANPGQPQETQLHIIDTVSIPLKDDGTQAIATRSTRPDTDGTS